MEKSKKKCYKKNIYITKKNVTNKQLQITTILPCSVDENFGEVIWPLADIKIEIVRVLLYILVTKKQNLSNFF